MAAASIFVAVILLRLSWENRLRRIDVGMFGFSMIFLYTCSGLFHAVHLPPEDRVIFRNLDMTAIYFLIAGSFTPLIVTFVPGLIRIFYLVFIWALVLAGVLVLWLVASPPYPVIVAIYIGLGAFGLLGVRYYVRGAGRRALPLMIFEPAIYIAGAVCDVIQKPVIIPGVIGPHEIFHLTDILGTFAHISIMMLYVIPVLRQNIGKKRKSIEEEASGESERLA